MNFTDKLRALRIDFRNGTKRGELLMCCPFCVDHGESEDTRFRLGISLIKNNGHCFNCGWASKQNTKAKVLRKLGAGKFAMEEESDDGFVNVQSNAQPQTIIEFPDDWEPAWKVRKDDKPAYDGVAYLMQRGITRFDMMRYNIGVSLSGRFQYRIIFPVLWHRKLKGLVARDWTGIAKARYLNSIGEKYLWNLPKDVGPEKICVLSEGIFKAIAIEKAVGLNSSIISASIQGHDVTEPQIQQLKEANAKQLILWPDPDRVGLKGLLGVAQKLISESFTVYTIWPVPQMQADELPPERLQQILSDNVVPFNWQIESKLNASLAFG